MENARQIRWITGNQSQRALAIESLEAIEQLPGDFQIRLHSQTHEYQFIDFCWCANGERCRSDAGDRKFRVHRRSLWRAGALRSRLSRARLSFPYWQTIDRALFEILIIRHCTNHLGETATGLDKV